MAEHDSVIPAGESGTLTAKVKTVEGQNRRFSKSITVVTDANDAVPLILRFTVEAYSPIVVQPSFRINLTTVEGSAGQSTVLLHRADGEALAVTEVAAEDPHLIVRARPVTGEDDAEKEKAGEAELWKDMAARRSAIAGAPGDVRIELATREESAAGTAAGVLHIRTNHPDAPELRLPYMVRVRPLIEVLPKSVRMWLSPVRGTEGRSALVSLRHNGGGEFTITGVEVSHPEIFAAAANSTGSAKRQVVRLSLTEGLVEDGLAGSVEGSVVVTTNDPVRQRVVIPVVVSPTRALTRQRTVATRPTPMH